MSSSSLSATFSGVLWPLEGMPGWLRYISYCLPSTLPAEAMRGVMGRGKVSSVITIKISGDYTTIFLALIFTQGSLLLYLSMWATVVSYLSVIMSVKPAPKLSSPMLYWLKNIYIYSIVKTFWFLYPPIIMQVGGWNMK